MAQQRPGGLQYITCYMLHITLQAALHITLHYTQLGSAGLQSARGAGMLQWPAAWAALPHLDVVGNNQHCTEHEVESSTV